MIQTGIIAAAEYLAFGFDETMPLDAGGGNKLDFVLSSSRSLRLLEREAIDDSLSRDLFSISPTRQLPRQRGMFCIVCSTI